MKNIDRVSQTVDGALRPGGVCKERRRSNSEREIQSGEDNVVAFLPSAEADANNQVPAPVATALQRARMHNAPAAACVLRLCEYRVFEETFGRLFCARLSVLFKERVQASVRSEDSLARIADDEFVLLLGGLGDLEDIVNVSERILAACRGVYAIDAYRVHVNATMGLARYPYDAVKASELLRCARIALHETRPNTLSPCHFFTPKQLEKLRERVWLAAELQDALDHGRFVLHYQPLFDIGEQRTVGAEALLRLRTTTGELLSPQRFIPLAEETGLILPIGSWVVQEACQQLGRWHREGARSLRMSINVSPRQFADQGFVGVVQRAVLDAGIDYADVTLEITEGAMIKNFPAIEQALFALNRLGVRIAVDDFGTGYSALGYLTRLPLSIVKIDRYFLSAIPQDRKATTLVAAIITLAQGMGLEVIAEGIETEQQYRFLTNTGCQFGQGFGFARPQYAADFGRFLGLSTYPLGRPRADDSKLRIAP